MGYVGFPVLKSNKLLKTDQGSLVKAQLSPIC